MKWPRNLALALLISFAAPRGSSAMLSFGYVSAEKAKAEGMEIRWQAAGPKGVWVELSFKTDGCWKAYAEPQRHHYIELKVRGPEKSAPLVRAALREDRSVPGRVAVSFTAERAKLHLMELWLVQYGPDIADVVRMEKFIALDKIDPPRGVKAAEAGGEQAPRDEGSGSGAPAASADRAAE